MLRSSLGFHTLSLTKLLLKSETQYLISDFKRYSKKTGAIQIYQDHGRLKIDYVSRAVGIGWVIRSDIWLDQIKLFVDVVEVTINPKILGNVPSYITAATYGDMEAAIATFNFLSANISPSLCTFEDYSLTRIDYCVNFSLNELVPGCTHEQMINLIRRADIPHHYRRWAEYDPTSHRMKSPPGSFYLMNNSVHINCYSKYIKYEDQSRKNMERGRPPIPEETMNESKDIIRFEVQCKPRKLYVRSYKDKKSGDTSLNQYQQLLTHEVCIDTIARYYKKTIGRGDWYTLQEAVRMIQSRHFNSQKEERLIQALKLVNERRSVFEAKKALHDRSLDAFKRTLSDLSSLNINPVTIPREWGIKHIPNLLYAYFDKVEEEKRREDMEELRMEWLKEYLHT